MNQDQFASMPQRTDQDSLPTQSSLIAKIKFRDDQAWRDFVDVYAPLIFQWCRQSSLNNDDCADVTQEVFSKLYRAIEKYDRRQNSNFRSWLWVVTRNSIRDFCRKKSREVTGEGGTQFHQILESQPGLDEVDDPTSPQLEQELLDRALQSVQNAIDPKTWSAFWQVQMENLSTDEVAQQLDMSPNSVRQAKSRVLRRIRDLMNYD